ncbi:MAG TPA: ABC transporter permease [Candidatus Polarisedimenticolia bacterium]|jgi:ABC-2 type transport system permease protein
MRNIWTIMTRELRSYFVSPIAYVILTFFLFIVGYFFLALVLQYSEFSMQASANPMWASQLNLHDVIVRNFYSTFGVIMIFVAPILSMRILAEERRMGTAELLLTAPISTGQLVMGKYLGALGFAAFMLLLTFQYPLYLIMTGAALEKGPLVAVYLGTLLMVGAFLSAGLFSSSLSSNQIISAIVGFVICLFFWVVGFLGGIGGGGGEYGELLKALSISEHYEDFLKGVIDTGSVVYYLTFIAFGLFLTQRVIDSGRWR